ncbi:hypothetical protein F5Y05DRAFT_109252 [Hypoxylon sp. FL0543]|nr:hypothetical protein F5Y05DRAFT_109252 [Hypoxylon sp. FL0543]
MARSISNFHAFPRLPTEVQMRIWKAFILITNKERLVMVDEVDREIIPTRFLAYSAFCVNFQSRSAFMELYPVPVAVYRRYPRATFVDDNSDKSLDYDFEDEDDGDSTTSQLSEIFYYRGNRCGCIYVNFSLDTFIVSGINRINFDLCDGRLRPPNYDITANNGTLPFELKECQRMKHLMEVTIFQKSQARRPIPPIRHLAKLNKHDYSRTVFSGVETCQHVYWFYDEHDLDDDYHDLQIDLLTLPGCELLDKWAIEAVLYDKKMLAKKPKDLSDK